MWSCLSCQLSLASGVLGCGFVPQRAVVFPLPNGNGDVARVKLPKSSLTSNTRGTSRPEAESRAAHQLPLPSRCPELLRPQHGFESESLGSWWASQGRLVQRGRLRYTGNFFVKLRSEYQFLLLVFPSTKKNCQWSNFAQGGFCSAPQPLPHPFLTSPSWVGPGGGGGCFKRSSQDAGGWEVTGLGGGSGRCHPLLPGEGELLVLSSPVWEYGGTWGVASLCRYLVQHLFTGAVTEPAELEQSRIGPLVCLSQARAPGLLGTQAVLLCQEEGPTHPT